MVFQLHKSSSSRDVQQPHKTINSRDIQQLRKPSSSHDVHQSHKSSNSNTVCKGQTYFHLQDEELLKNSNLEEDHTEEDNEVNSQEDDTYSSSPQEEENFGSSVGASVTRKESRALSETRKGRFIKGKILFEVDDCAVRIIGDDSQRFITKGGCLLREFAKFDGTTWRNQDSLLKMDIISKCTENSSFDPDCRVVLRAIQTQLASQHKNRQYKFHIHYKKFSTKEEAIKYPPNGIKPPDWVSLCEKFASENFQKVSETNVKNKACNEVPPAVGTVSIARTVAMLKKGEFVSAIDQFKIGHFSKKQNKMINEKADEIWNELLIEQADSTCSSEEICLKKLGRIPGHIKGRSVSTRQILENLRRELELEKEKSKTLEITMLESQEKQTKFQEDQNQKMEVMMQRILSLTKSQSYFNKCKFGLSVTCLLYRLWI